MTKPRAGRMTVCRIVGWLLVAAALGALTFEMMEAVGAGRWRMMALGELWFRLHAPSLNLAQAAIQRHISPWLWEPAITTVLLWPGWLVFGVPGAGIAWLCRKRKRYFERRLG